MKSSDKETEKQKLSPAERRLIRSTDAWLTSLNSGLMLTLEEGIALYHGVRPGWGFDPDSTKFGSNLSFLQALTLAKKAQKKGEIVEVGMSKDGMNQHFDPCEIFKWAYRLWKRPPPYVKPFLKYVKNNAIPTSKAELESLTETEIVRLQIRLTAQLVKQKAENPSRFLFKHLMKDDKFLSIRKILGQSDKETARDYVSDIVPSNLPPEI